MHRGTQFAIEMRQKHRITHGLGGLHARQRLTHHRMPLLGAADGFDHVTEKRRMHVAEITHAAAIIQLGQ